LVLVVQVQQLPLAALMVQTLCFQVQPQTGAVEVLLAYTQRPLTVLMVAPVVAHLPAQEAMLLLEQEVRVTHLQPLHLRVTTVALVGLALVMVMALEVVGAALEGQAVPQQLLPQVTEVLELHHL
jgi:hypothetical protein